MHSALAEYMVLVSPWMHECASYIYIAASSISTWWYRLSAHYITHMHGLATCMAMAVANTHRSLSAWSSQSIAWLANRQVCRLTYLLNGCRWSNAFVHTPEVSDKKKRPSIIYIYVYTHTDANIFGCLFHKWGYLNGFVIMDTIINFMI